jgi:Glycosyltransferase 61
MNISPIRQSKNAGVVHQLEDSLRDSFVLELNNVELSGRNLHYPNCLLKIQSGLISPYDERVMSLKRDSFYDNNIWDGYQLYTKINTFEDPVFFFVYNVDNYYHYIYDTLSILASYFIIKNKYPNIKLMINTSHPDKIQLAPFVREFLKVYGITDFILPSLTTTYKKMFVSTSFTHGGKSNEPPSVLAKSIWNPSTVELINTPKRFYISRRSWIHGKTENIGTNYTTRRKCMNEDAVVALLEGNGIQEVFTELLTTEEKLAYFKNAELVVGVVGGGMCNLLFSPPSTKVVCINTPGFLDINARFQHSMNHTKIVYSNSTKHYEENVKFQLYTRVKIINTASDHYGLVGEIESRVNGKTYTVRLSSNDIAGFSQDFLLETKNFPEEELEAIDNGLNSPYVCDIDMLDKDLRKA